MAHKIRVKAVPHRNVNGTLSKTKKDYIVKCHSRKKTCFTAQATTQKAADTLVESHRMDHFVTHRLLHPKDNAHHAKHGSGHVTKKQVPSRFLPLHSRGTKHLAAIAEMRKRNKAVEAEESAS